MNIEDLKREIENKVQAQVEEIWEARRADLGEKEREYLAILAQSVGAVVRGNPPHDMVMDATARTKSVFGRAVNEAIAHIDPRTKTNGMSPWYVYNRFSNDQRFAFFVAWLQGEDLTSLMSDAHAVLLEEMRAELIATAAKCKDYLTLQEALDAIHD